jgi:membrane-bound acyltransferase YfiQ involved in biofilm formation
MKSKVVLVALLAALMCILVGFSVPTAFAQGEATTAEASVTFGWIVAAWLIYSFVGFFASGEPFNGLKFARTFLVTIIVAFIAIALKITPANVVTSYGSIIDQFASLIINTGPGIGLIYLFEKLFKFSQLVKTKLEKAKELASAPGPPKPTA